MRQLHRDLARILLREVAGGAWGEGARLPKEVDLHRAHGVSRGVVREALGALEARGVVSIRHGSGAFVQPRRAWHVLDDEVAEALMRGRGRNALLREIGESRVLLEPPAAALAAERATKPAVSELAGALGRLERGGDVRPALQDFHLALLEASGNRALTQALRGAVIVHVRHGAEPGDRDADECRAILDAVAAGDADAARGASRAHLERASRAALRRRSA